MAKDPEIRRESNAAYMRAKKWKDKLRAPDGRRCIPVRLSDVPVGIRLDAARAVMRDEHVSDRPTILAAALYPSDDIHWIAA